MNVKSKNKGEHNTVELVIEVDAKTFDDACNRVYNRRRKSINIPGFRKGRRPGTWWSRCMAPAYSMRMR